MFVHFRERIGIELINLINKQVVREILSEEHSQPELQKNQKK